MRVLLAVLVGAVALQAASGAQLRASGEIRAAFSKDGFDVVQEAQFQGARGFVAHARNASNLKTGKPKAALYVEGNSYAMGYLTGLLRPDEVTAMATTFVSHCPIHMLSRDIDWEMWHSNNTLAKALYNTAVDMLGDFITEESVKGFWKDRARGNIPEDLYLEIRGVFDGLRRARPDTKVTLARLIALNYGIDYLSAKLFGKTLASEMRAMAGRRGFSPAFVAAFLAMPLEGMLHAPASCDAFCVANTATESGKDVFFARDFQFGDGRVFQDVSCLTVVVPTDGRAAAVLTHAPGMVGAITSVNEYGVAMGVDTLESEAANPEVPGLNSILMVRHTTMHAKSAAQGVDIVGAAHRGVPWLHPLCDRSGDGYVLESGMYTEGMADPLRFICNATLRAALPSKEALLAAVANTTARHIHGLWVRPMDFEAPESITALNGELFRLAGLDALPASAWAPEGFMAATLKAEGVIDSTVLNNYFPPSRTFGTSGRRGVPKDAFVVSNHAVVPAARTMQMGDSIDALTHMARAASTQWRYDKLAALIRRRVARGGYRDLEDAKTTILFLDPDRKPGYWHKRIVPDDPMSAMVEGAITVADLTRGTVQLKSGYYEDPWVQVTLPNYIRSQ